MALNVVMFSGGVGSWAAARRVAAKHGTDNLVLLFADTLIEDEDLYRFVEEAAADVGGRLVRICEGRTPWQVFRDERYIGNTRADPCSKLLKRELLRKWVRDNTNGQDASIYLGIDWTEEHRYVASRDRWLPWPCYAPLCEAPFLSKVQLLKEAVAAGLRVPRLYSFGFPHNNCGGFCIKAGQAHFKRLLEVMPERYAMHEKAELELGAHLGKTVTILRDRRGGRTRPLSLKELRERVEAGGPVDKFEWGGCGCVA